jgi:hypothetical protein
MNIRFLSSFILSALFLIGPLHAVKDKINTNNSDEEERAMDDQNIEDHQVPIGDIPKILQKRKRQEDGDGKKPIKKRKLSKLEIEQDKNYPETITWEELLKAIGSKRSVYIGFITNEIRDEKEKEGFLNAFKKIYNKNQTLLKNANVAIALAKYFIKKYRTNIDPNMVLIDIFYKIKSMSKATKLSIPEIILKFNKKDINATRVAFIKKTFDNLLETERSPVLLFGLLNYLLDNKNLSEKDIQVYVENYETKTTIKKDKKNIILLSSRSQKEDSFSNFFNLNLSKKNAEYIKSLSENKQQILKCALEKLENSKYNEYIENLRKFHEVFPYLFKTVEKIGYYRNGNHSFPVDSLCRCFKVKSFLSMSKEELKIFTDEYIAIFKLKLGKNWKKVIPLCSALSFDQISMFCHFLSAEDVLSEIMQDNFICFAECVGSKFYVEKPLSFILIEKIRKLIPDISDKELNNIKMIILYNSTFNSLGNVNYKKKLKKISYCLMLVLEFLGKIRDEVLDKSELVSLVCDILCNIAKHSNIKNAEFILYLAKNLTVLEYKKMNAQNVPLFDVYYDLLKNKLFSLFSLEIKGNDEKKNAPKMKRQANIKSLKTMCESIDSIQSFLNKSIRIVNLDNNLANIFKNYITNISDNLISKIPNLIFLNIGVNDENIRAALDSLFRTLNQLADDRNWQNLTPDDHIELTEVIYYLTPYCKGLDEVKFFSDCIEKGIAVKNDYIYEQILERRDVLSRIYVRLNGTQINYNDRQSVHTSESHKAADDMIQDLWKTFPLDDYKYNLGKEIKYYNEDGAINLNKTYTLNNIGLENIFKSVVPDVDLEKHLYFLYEALNVPRGILNYIINYDEKNSEKDNAILLNSSDEEYQMSKMFHNYFIEFKNKFKLDPNIPESQKDISFRELFNKACIHLQKERRFSVYGELYSAEQIRLYENAFLCYRAKKMLQSIVSKRARSLNEFRQPKKGAYDQGLFALLLRAILNVYATTPNLNDLKDKFMTLRNNLAYASLEYSLENSACTFGQTYNILEQFLNNLGVGDVISVDSSNFNQILIILAQAEVERIKNTSGSVEEKLELLKSSIVRLLKDPKQYSQDFWDKIVEPLKTIEQTIEGLRTYFEEDEDDEITIEEEN